ncbi:MAG: hypothetical protein CVU64_19115 [Deltaproteobacteria bacterium HGW-Deltaproteobacteria-21]|nr:MAG: hypothetical protein CVU64_19115 [Deltaproteobacteria bacterium HGW-Deltaproteobacteria-21]
MEIFHTHPLPGKGLLYMRPSRHSHKICHFPSLQNRDKSSVQFSRIFKREEKTCDPVSYKLLVSDYPTSYHWKSAGHCLKDDIGHPFVKGRENEAVCMVKMIAQPIPVAPGMPMDPVSDGKRMPMSNEILRQRAVSHQVQLENGSGIRSQHIHLFEKKKEIFLLPEPPGKQKSCNRIFPGWTWKKIAGVDAVRNYHHRKRILLFGECLESLGVGHYGLAVF